MPLKKGKSKRKVQQNIVELINSGMPHKRAVETAMRQAGMMKPMDKSMMKKSMDKQMMKKPATKKPMKKKRGK